MSSRHHIDDFMRGRIIGKIEEGRKITDVAREFDIADSVVSRLWKSFKTTGMCSRRHEGSRFRSTTPAEERYIVLSAKRNRRTTAQQVANQFLAASGKQISRKTVARRLRGGGLYARRPVVCVSLTRQHRTARLQWCREHHNWTEQDWACVLFSDESRFSLSSDCRRQLIWRASGTAYRPENIQEKTDIRHAVSCEGIQRFVWPVRFPDLNHIENVWDTLGRQVAGRNYPPTNKNTLIRALTEEWDKLPQQLLDNVAQTPTMWLVSENKIPTLGLFDDLDGESSVGKKLKSHKRFGQNRPRCIAHAWGIRVQNTNPCGRFKDYCIKGYNILHKPVLFLEERHVFQDDNTPLHISRCVQTWLPEYVDEAKPLARCQQSPDLNIECLYGFLENKIRARFPLSSRLSELQMALCEECV
ncbi:transposable element Tcb1 transposase [Trichonephila clavipes]|nr:transposable element Tcb1 transposase [Trichonephila clavipes]